MEQLTLFPPKSLWKGYNCPKCIYNFVKENWEGPKFLGSTCTCGWSSRDSVAGPVK